MNPITLSPIRWGVSGTPWTHDIDEHRRIGLLDFRHNWCRLNPAQWSSAEHNAGSWTLTDNAKLAKEIIDRGGRFVEVLIDRQQVLGGEGNAARMNISSAIATWDTLKLALLRDEIREVRAAMPSLTYGELWNGDEFGPGCGFPWDPLREEFWKEMGLSMPKGSTIRSRFTRFGNEIAAIWGGEFVIAEASHVYLFPNGVAAHRRYPTVRRVCTEVGIASTFMDSPSAVIRLSNALIASGVEWAFWHQPWPGNPGDGGAFQQGNKFMYDGDRYRAWLKTRSWPDYEGVMLRQAGETLAAVIAAS